VLTDEIIEEARNNLNEEEEIAAQVEAIVAEKIETEEALDAAEKAEEKLIESSDNTNTPLNGVSYLVFIVASFGIALISMGLTILVMKNKMIEKVKLTNMKSKE
jgi:hypothetical protein